MRCEPPRYASIEFLRRVAGYAVQERALGGLARPGSLTGCIFDEDEAES
jgi:hypothetical protein